MASPQAGPSGLDRLVAQLHGFSEVAEALTLRLLELEERVEAQQARLASLERLAEVVAGDRVEERLLGTEQRLARIEGLLRGVERSGSPPPLKRLPQPPLQQEPLRSLDGPEACSPFPEEGEQAFMDEQRIA
ncbi:MAG: hypothetical protein VKI81_08770 [Synechococcaceae cyanobacterium]|nr:hypothetical protein [Synechococcaceae cyanobacterium]